jgi:hypothetical protein
MPAFVFGEKKDKAEDLWRKKDPVAPTPREDAPRDEVADVPAPAAPEARAAQGNSGSFWADDDAGRQPYIPQYLGGPRKPGALSAIASPPPVEGAGEVTGARYLREIPRGKLGVLAAFSVPASAITGTEEYRSYMDGDLRWQWQFHATPDEALLACRFILFDIAAGSAVGWDAEAREYLLRARKALGKRDRETKDAQPPAADKSAGPDVLPDPSTLRAAEPDRPDAGPPGPAREEVDEKKRGLSTPVLPGEKDIFRRFQELVDDLRRRGEDDKADDLSRMMEKDRGLLGKLQILVGGFTVAIIYSSGRISLVWKEGLEAGDMLLERAMSRAEPLTEELQEHLQDLEREGLRVTDARGAGVLRRPKHHVFPQAMRAYFEERGMVGPLDIDNYCVEMDVFDHEAIHGGGDRVLAETWEGEWNRRVSQALRDAEAQVGRNLTPPEIISKVVEQMDRIRLPRDFVHYHDKDE